MKNHTSCYYFPLFICTRLVLSFEYDNICSVLISTSLMITKIMNVSVDCKKKIIHCSVLLEIHVSHSIEFCHCANSFCLEIGISRLFFLWLPIDILFFRIPRKKLITRAMCGNTMAFSEARGAAIVAIHHDSFPDRLFFIILIQRKNRQSIGHPSNWTPTTNLRTIIQNFD